MRTVPGQKGGTARDDPATDGKAGEQRAKRRTYRLSHQSPAFLPMGEGPGASCGGGCGPGALIGASVGAGIAALTTCPGMPVTIATTSATVRWAVGAGHVILLPVLVGRR